MKGPGRCSPASRKGSPQQTQTSGQGVQGCGVVSRKNFHWSCLRAYVPPFSEVTFIFGCAWAEGPCRRLAPQVALTHKSDDLRGTGQDQRAKVDCMSTC